MRSLPIQPASLAVLLLAPAASAQDEYHFSVDYQGPLIGSSTPAGPVTDADILRVVAPMLGGAGPTDVAFTGAIFGLPNFNNCVGHAPGVPCGIDVDALSYGDDLELNGLPGQPFMLLFSTDEYALGHPALIGPFDVRTESPVGDLSADTFGVYPLPPAPVPPPPPAQPRRQIYLLDGNGLVSPTGAVAPAAGLTEPNRPGFGLPGFPFDEGDNVDAFNVGPPPNLVTGAIYFSLDAGFPDLDFGYQNSNSGQLNGAPPSAVLTTAPGGGAFTIYANPGELGLDAFLDDVDALILSENGIPGFQPSMLPYDWVGSGLHPGPTSDMLLFSVRRGSALIGVIDSLLGLPIEPGDILTTPLGGVGPPGIFFTAESLGLTTERESGVGPGDDVDGADLRLIDDAFLDCNGNGVEDAVDIALGTSLDCDLNNIPDECEPPGSGFCYCTPALAPCGNDDGIAGCENSTGVGGLLEGSGTSSITSDALVLTASQLPAHQFGLMFMGPAQTTALLSDGLLCVAAGGVSLYRYPVFNSGASGSTMVTGVVGYSGMSFPPPGQILSGATWNFQIWYRDPSGPCSSNSNTTNGWEVCFTP